MYALRDLQSKFRCYAPKGVSGEKIAEELGGSVEREWTCHKFIGPYNHSEATRMMETLLGMGANASIKAVYEMRDNCNWKKILVRCRQTFCDQPMHSYELKAKFLVEKEQVDSTRVHQKSVSVEASLSEAEGQNIWVLAGNTTVGTFKEEKERLIVTHWFPGNKDLRLVISKGGLYLHYELEEQDVMRDIEFDDKSPPWATLDADIDAAVAWLEAHELLPSGEANVTKLKLRCLLPRKGVV